MSGAVPGPKAWLLYAFATTILWGLWGAFTGLPAERGFPETLVYCVWSVTMLLPALYALARAGWRLDRDPRSVAYGVIIGLTGAGGQMLLFHAVTTGPPYLIFPLISLSPVVTIAMSFLLLGERTNMVGAAGILLALAALPLFDFSESYKQLSSLMALVTWVFISSFILILGADLSARQIIPQSWTGWMPLKATQRLESPPEQAAK